MTVIRPHTDADFEGVGEVSVRSWQAGYAGIVPAEYLAGLDPVRNAERRRNYPMRPDQHLLVAEADGKIVGFANFGPYLRDDGGFDEGMGHLYAIYVHPDRWGRGIGRELFLAAKAGLTADGFPDLRLWVLTANVRARRFYERLGLAPDGVEQSWTPRDSPVELPEMRYATPL
ncbi:GNAT family N-acetyltransferase [Paractinoplanes rishiriensis]|uniref:N-acetyltransferase n=1 Tax=Paractinoplanes rishiriensis TaxID=1050105 RepID=A0A919MVF6_9ACTN|nr:GNAT family N-acetyltransferase [Actinoplanes rishiriensis]GIE93560.1 N-acetyltransferase [Actinoplanes rishiriensis]